VIGADRLSNELSEINKKANSDFTKLELDYTYDNSSDPNKYYQRSDHYNFAKNNVPIIFYFNGAHDDYHKPTDTPDKIDFPLIKKRAQLVFLTAWELVNRSERIKLNK
jgi:Zn-dependent M28 family amino/carboxypeptidase